MNAKNKDGETPLHFAAWHGDIELVKLLIEMDAQVNVHRSDGITPLGLATGRVHTETAEILKAAAAD